MCRHKHTVNIGFVRVHFNPFGRLGWAVHSSRLFTTKCILVKRIQQTNTHARVRLYSVTATAGNAVLLCIRRTNIEMVFELCVSVERSPHPVLSHTRWGYVKISIYRDSRLLLPLLCVLLCRQTASDPNIHLNSIKTDCRVIEVCTIFLLKRTSSCQTHWKGVQKLSNLYALTLY